MDDVVLKEQGSPLVEATRWIDIALVHTKGEYLEYWFCKNTRSAWDLAQDVKFRSLDGNLYTLQFLYLGDWEKVLDGGPWSFRGDAVLMVSYDGFTKPSMIPFVSLEYLVQIHDLPDEFPCMVKALASKVGEFIVVETSYDSSGNFLSCPC